MKKLRTVNPHDPAEPGLVMECYNDGTVKRKSLGVPVRLMMATQIAAGMYANGVASGANIAANALMVADELIAEHNKAVEELNEKEKR